ncbi:MAG: TauD/TfdA family dioxygenase, partial [Rhodospirillaceae bacterium]
DWRGAEMLSRDDWIHRLDSKEIAEIDAAFQQVRDKGISFADMTRENFPLERFPDIAARARETLEMGPGLFLIRGLPTLKYSHRDLRLIYWGLGKHMGTAVCQSSDGDVLGDVRDINVDINGPRGRGYRTNQQLSFHCDSCDVVGLFVLRTPQSGGLSMIASSLAIRNEIARTRPDLLEVLYQPFPWSMQGQEKPGQAPYYPQPVYSDQDGHFCARLVRAHITNAQRFAGAPPLSKAQTEALDLIGELAASEEFHFSMMFEPGDFQLLNNHVTMHSRTAFVDYPEAARKRHLLRMWLSVPNSRPLSPLMGHLARDQTPGAVRGGFPSLADGYVYETPISYGGRPST